MVKRKKEKKENVSNISESSPMSYEKYLTTAFDIISPHLSIRIYKLAPKDDYPFFRRDIDLRVQFYWKKKSIYEFVVERSFFYQSNKNKEDRKYMRGHADFKIKMIKDAIIRKPKPKSEPVAAVNKTKKSTVGSTQQKFEDMKKKK